MPTTLPAPAPSEDQLIGIRKIMVPSDLSPHSDKAIRYAIRFAQIFGAEIELVYIVHAEGYTGLVTPEALDNVENELRQEIRQDLEKLVGERERHHFHIKTMTSVGDPAKELAKLAQDHKTDLLLLSTHGRTGLSRMLLGSTAERMVRLAPCPVLVVREKEHEFISEECRNAGVAAAA